MFLKKYLTAEMSLLFNDESDFSATSCVIKTKKIKPQKEVAKY